MASAGRYMLWGFVCWSLILPPAWAGVLENPRDGSAHSGVSVISGWVCEATQVRIHITTEREEGRHTEEGEWEVVTEEFPVASFLAAYGTERDDTREVCGDTDNGFGVLFNWNNLGPGTYTVAATVHGPEGWAELGRAAVTITTLGWGFREHLTGRYVLEGFPIEGESVVVEWEEALQNFVITEYRDWFQHCPAVEPLPQAVTVLVAQLPIERQVLFCARALNGSEDWLTYGALSWWLERQIPGQFHGSRWQRWVPEHAEDIAFFLVAYSLAPGASTDRILPAWGPPAPEGTYRACFEYDVGVEHETKRTCSEPFEIPASQQTQEGSAE